MPTLITLVDGTVPVAADFNDNYTALNNAIGSATAISAWAIGELPYASATNTLARLTPGSVGKVLTMTSTIPNWEGGAWVTPAFSAGAYTAGGSQTWTLTEPDVLTHAYIKIGRTITIAVDLATTTVGGTPHAELRIALPFAAAAKPFVTTCLVVDNGVGGIGVMSIAAGGSVIVVNRNPALDSWTASTNNTTVAGEITYESAS